MDAIVEGTAQRFHVNRSIAGRRIRAKRKSQHRFKTIDDSRKWGFDGTQGLPSPTGHNCGAHWGYDPELVSVSSPV